MSFIYRCLNMRYTTLIDISELPSIYCSVSVRLVYLHYVLKAGYHDHDRDNIPCSIRQCAADTGLTVSAVRCSLARLMRVGLVLRQDGFLKVVKYIPQQTITPRPKTARQAKQQTVTQERESQQAAIEAERDKERTARETLHQQGKTSWMVWYEAQVAKAEAGDIEAKETVARHRKTYEEQKEIMKQTH